MKSTVHYGIEFHNVFEGFMNRFVKTKSKLLKNPYLEGVNLVFPYLDRRKSVFIDMVILGTNVADRRAAAVEYLKKKGFAVEEIRVGSETLLKNRQYILPYLPNDENSI